ncbi:MAG: nitrile hydratase [Pseudomonadota bacterium]
MGDTKELRGVHDVGGLLDEPFEASEHDYLPWEKRVHAIRELLAEKGLLRVDELRRAIESAGEEEYRKLTYYEQWVSAICKVMLERGVVTDDELGRRIAEIDQRDG